MSTNSERVRKAWEEGKMNGFTTAKVAGAKNVNWRGDAVGYTALHEWIVRVLGSPSKCSCCGIETAKKYEWANISGKYKRNTSDWKRLCVSCHRRQDGHGKKAWETRRKRYGASGFKNL